jgi:hypothetical protein
MAPGYENEILVEILNQHDFVPRKLCRFRGNFVSLYQRSRDVTNPSVLRSFKH